MAQWEDYLIPGTQVLKNRLGLTDHDALVKAENENVLQKLSDLYLSGMDGDFSVSHLCEINLFLFGDIYEFAGKFREVDVFKKTGFEHYKNIPQKLDELFHQMKYRNINTTNKFEIAQYIADFYYGIISIHPFREGNGRTAREFIRQLVLTMFPEYELDYTKVNKDNFLIGVIDHSQYPSLLAYEIYNALVPNPLYKSKNL